MNNLLEDNFSNKTTIENLKKELKKIKLEIMVKENQLRELKKKNPLVLNASEKQKKLLSNLENIPHEKLLKEIF